MKGGEYDVSNSGWIKNANYDVSLYCATECGGASAISYECGYVWRGGSTNRGHKEVNASVVGCHAGNGAFGRALVAGDAVAYGADNYAGGFALGNPSL